MPGEGGGEEVAALEIDVDDGVPLRPGDLGRRPLQWHPGIVDQHADRAERGSSLLDRLRNAAFGAKVERDRRDLAVVQLRLRNDFVQRTRIEIRNGEIETRLAERKRDRPADAGRCAGDQRGAGRRFAHDTLSGKSIQRRSAMLRWQASAKATSRMPEARLDGSGAPATTWCRNCSQPIR